MFDKLNIYKVIIMLYENKSDKIMDAYFRFKRFIFILLDHLHCR